METKKTVLMVSLLALFFPIYLLGQTNKSAAANPSSDQAVTPTPTLKYTLSLRNEACLGKPFVFRQELTNISDHDVRVYPEYTQRGILQRAWDRSLTNSPWMHIPEFTQSFGDPLIMGDGPETRVLRPASVFRKEFRLRAGMNFYRSSGKYSIQLTYIPPGKDAVSVESNELIFHVSDCSKG